MNMQTAHKQIRWYQCITLVENVAVWACNEVVIFPGFVLVAFFD